MGIWSWLRDKENRAIVAFAAGGMLAVFPGGLYVYDNYFSSLDVEADREQVCLAPPGTVSDDVSAAMHRGAAEFTLIASQRPGMAGEDKILDMHQALYRAYPDVNKGLIDLHFLHHLCEQIYSSPVFNASVRNELRNLCAQTIIPIDTRSRGAGLTVTQVDDPVALAGEWVGEYYYPLYENLDKNEPVPFRMRLVRDGRRIVGGAFEPNTFGPHPGDVLELFALIEGAISDTGIVTFRKTYQGTDGQSHAVRYEGVWDPDSGSISGKWTISPQWWGRFVMQRPVTLTGPAPRPAQRTSQGPRALSGGAAQSRRAASKAPATLAT